MVGSLLFFASLQAPTPVREFKPGLERRYRIEASRGEETFEYRLRTKVVLPEKGKEKDGIRLDVSFSDYRATAGDRKIAIAKLGGGLVSIAPTGLPSGFSVSGAQGAVWLPLFGFYLPVVDGTFDIPDTPLDGGTVLAGKGASSQEDGRTISLDATLSRDGKPVGNLRLATTLDAAGWPLRASGTYVDETGTLRFTLAKA